MTTIKFLILFAAIPTFADELDLRHWESLSVIAKQHQREQQQSQSLLPPTLQPTTSRFGVLQQVLTYNVDQVKTAHPTASAVVDSSWNGGFGPADDSDISFRMQPVNTKASIDFGNQMKASMSYQPWSGQTEVRLTPTKKIFGLKVEFSHAISPTDRTDRILLSLAW